MSKFTNTAIDAMPAKTVLYDDLVIGLHIKAGVKRKSFNLYFRTKTGIERRPMLGKYGLLSIAQAREIARAMLVDVAQGRDPIAERTKARGEPTLRDLWQRCEKEHWNKDRDWDRDAKRIYHSYIHPRIGTLRVRNVGYDDADRVHKALSPTPTQANRAIAVLSTMLTLAERWGWRDLNSNPCGLIVRNRERKRKRFAKPHELAAIGPLLEEAAKTNPKGAAFIYVMLFSGARPSEIEHLPLDRIEHREDGSGVLRIEDGKTDHRDVFLPKQAMEVIRRVPSTGANPHKLWKAIRKAAGCQDLWVRDLRRTFSTVGLSYGGIDGKFMGELLGHKSAQTTMIYTKLMEDPAAAASATVANKMEELLNGR